MGEVGSRSLEEMYTSKHGQGGGDPCLMNDPKHIMTFPFLPFSSLVFTFSTLHRWSHFLKLLQEPPQLCLSFILWTMNKSNLEKQKWEASDVYMFIKYGLFTIWVLATLISGEFVAQRESGVKAGPFLWNYNQSLKFVFYLFFTSASILLKARSCWNVFLF